MQVKNGDANFTGFEIKGDNGIVVSSKNYVKDAGLSHLGSLDKRFSFVFFLLVSISLMMGHILLFFSKINNVRFLLSIIFLLVLDVLMWGLFIVFHNKKLRRWHAREHKVANLMESGLILTLENLRKMSRLYYRCGSQLFCLIIMVLLGNYLLLTLTKIGIIWSLLYTVCLGAIFFLIIFGNMRSIKFPIQYLVTKEPDEEQLLEALRVANEFVGKEKQLISG